MSDSLANYPDSQTPDTFFREDGPEGPEPDASADRVKVLNAIDWNTVFASIRSIESDLIASRGGIAGPFTDLAEKIASMGAGWIRITDITPQSGGDTVSSKVFQDAPANTIIQSGTSSSPDINIHVESSFPVVDVDGNVAVLAKTGDLYAGIVAITLAVAGDVVAAITTPDGFPGTSDKVVVALDAPPVITALSFTGGYPGSQTELKEDDTFQITVTADKAFDLVEIQNFGACKFANLGVSSGTTAIVTGTIDDEGTTVQDLAARVRVRDSVTGAFSTTRDTNTGGGTADGVDTVKANNLFPGVAIGTITYPASQAALKGAESATVANVLSDFDTVAYDDPTTSELTITLPSTSEDPKTVTRAGGTYNVTTPNFRITANRAANDATTVDQVVVSIADVAATLVVSEPAARLLSGGNDGTAEQLHSITITASQELLSAPTLALPAGGGRGTRGIFQGGGFVGGPSVWTRTLGIHDDDGKGLFAWGAILGTNLAGIPTSVITGDPSYTLGGFVKRTLTFASFTTVTPMDVEVVTFAKLAAGIFTSTNQTALRQPISTPPSVTDGYTIDATGVKPTDVIWLDTPAAGANSSGDATITDVEETV